MCLDGSLFPVRVDEGSTRADGAAADMQRLLRCKIRPLRICSIPVFSASVRSLRPPLKVISNGASVSLIS